MRARPASRPARAMISSDVPGAPPTAAVEGAERGHEGNGRGARELEGADRERRRMPEERHRDVAPGTEGAVSLQCDRLAASQRRHQGQRDRRVRPGYEADTVAVAT